VHHPSESGVPLAEDQLDRFERLHAADRPGRTPSTPASAHDGVEPGGGGSGNMQR
jgi:hypothetical protein